ncbi:MAG TPA: aquaporin [Cytophagaceae bacterium]|nr:aquaporin [Cytophagaceae bacterium]
MEKLKLYLSEGLGLGIFMFSAGFFSILIEHPDFYVREIITIDIIRRFFIGLTMGLTALFIIHSSFGKKSGAHINPAVTLTFLRLNHISKKDAFFYIIFQFLGGSLGLYLISVLMPESIKHPLINYIITIPGKEGLGLAFLLEFIISFFLILTVLVTSAHSILSKYTSYCVAALITLYITFEAPYSGMSMNPARTFSSAIVANVWTDFWIYCIAPVLAMLSAGEVWLRFLKKK